MTIIGHIGLEQDCCDSSTEQRAKHTTWLEAEWRIYASLNWVIIGSDNGLAPVQRHAIIWTNAVILLIGPSGTNFSEILIGIQTFSFKKLHLKTSSAKWHLFCLGLNELRDSWSSGMWPHFWGCVPQGGSQGLLPALVIAALCQPVTYIVHEQGPIELKAGASRPPLPGTTILRLDILSVGPQGSP